MLLVPSIVFFLVAVITSIATQVIACNKVACAACSGICACDYPICDCCPQCLACLGSLWAKCCDCFGKCDSLKNLVDIRPQLAVNITLQKQLLVNTGLMPTLPQDGRENACPDSQSCRFFNQCFECGAHLATEDLTCCQGKWLASKRSDCCH